MNVLQSEPEDVTQHPPIQGEQNQVGAEDNPGVYPPFSGSLNDLME
jgi:hypothetical protein